MQPWVAPFSPRISSIGRLLIGYLLVMAVLGGGFALATVLLVRAADRDRALALIDSDIAETADKIGRDPATQRERALAIVLARSAQPSDRLYRLTQNGVHLAGLPPEVAFVPDDGILVSRAPPAIALTVPLARDAELLVGRRLQQGALTSRLLLWGSIALGLVIAIAAAIGLIATRRLGARVAAINAACDAVRLGDFTARAPVATRNDEFSALAGHVNGMLERIDTLVMGLRDVSNRIAHDLRTPVARLRTNIEQAARADDLTDARTLAGAAAAETDEVLQTFEALLDIAEVEAGSTGGLAPIRLDEAVAAAVDLYASVAEASGVALRTDMHPCTILGERMLVIRLAANLIDNAIKYSPAESEVLVAVREDEGWTNLIVKDAGPGIPDEARAGMFARFARHDQTRAVPGHGLGLALVQAVVKRHGARVILADAAPGLEVAIAFPSFSAG